MLMAERIVLLALDYEHGEINTGIHEVIVYSFIGGLLYDLYFMKKIDLDKDNRLFIRDGSEKDLGNEKLLIMIIKYLKEKKQESSIHDIIIELKETFSNIENLIVEKIIDKKYLKKSEKRFLWIFKKEKLHPRMIDLELDIRHTLHFALIEGKGIQPGIVGLISLIYPIGLIKTIFSKNDYDLALENAKKLIGENHFAKTISNAVQELVDNHFELKNLYYFTFMTSP